MGVEERLSLEAVSAHTLIAVEHRHRYEFARAACTGKRVVDLCCGTGYGSAILAEVAASVTGVDRDAAAVDTAQATSTAEHVTFTAADALDYLRALEPADVDVVVCFEGLEHLPAVEEAVHHLTRLVAAGVGLIASAPNSSTFEEENEFHLTDFDLPRFREMFAATPGATFAYQTHAEGSLIRGRTAGDVTATVRLSGEQDLDWANHFLVLAGVDASALMAAADANLQLAVAPVSHRYMRHLERANRGLLATNNRLARERLGLGAGGAGSAVLRREAEAQRAQEEAREAAEEVRAELARLRQAEIDLQRDVGVLRETEDGLRQQLATAQAQAGVLKTASRRAGELEAERDELRAERDGLRTERDSYRRAWVVVRSSRLTKIAARLAGHRFD